MIDTSQAQVSKVKVSERLLRALQNERCIDLRYRQLNPKFASDPTLPNYKVMKQVALRRRLGWLYRPAIVVARMSMPFYSMLQWCVALLFSLNRSRASTANGHVISTAPNNVALIQAALRNDCELAEINFDTDLLETRRLAASLGTIGVLRSIASYCLLLRNIVFGKRGECGDLLLHSRDAFQLIMLCHYIDTHPHQWFATECHYQRWAFLLSHSAPRWALVQHGFLDTEIDFTNECGSVTILFGRSDISYGQFRQLYRIDRFAKFAPVIRLKPNKFAERALFLASSFPSIAEEITVLRGIKERIDVPVIVKFHPSHAYDERKSELAALADLICSGTDYPDCKVFVSNNSFMEFDYQSIGKKTFAISTFCDVGAAIDAITSWLAEDSSPLGEDNTGTVA
jgi:hypothetical protein